MEEYQLLERELGKWIGGDGVVACSSGTAALHLALEAFQIPQPHRREVLCPDFTMYACARSISLSGMKSIFVDCNNDLLIDPKLIESAITDKTIAIMAVHIYGRLFNMTAIHEIASKYHLFVIEDMA